jgi:3-(3-hydroxy-phenyl)propionate hydroxylase
MGAAAGLETEPPSAPGIPVWREIGAAPHPATERENASVVIVGGGPVGLAMAIELGRRGHPVLLLNRLDFISAGSKAICFAKRTLDIFDRLEVGDPIVDKGVVWNVGKVFWGDRDEPVYQFDMLPVKQQKRPGFINIQQYHVEERLYEAAARLDTVQMRFGHEVVAAQPEEAGVRLTVRTSGGEYIVDADWVIACDGCRSPVRSMLGLDFEGRIFEDNFLPSRSKAARRDAPNLKPSPDIFTPIQQILELDLSAFAEATFGPIVRSTLILPSLTSKLR